MTYLEQVERLQQRRARWPWLLAAAVVLILATATVTWMLAVNHTPTSGSSEPEVGTATSSSAAPGTSPTGLQYGSSMAACQGVDALIKAGTLDNMDQLRAFADAAADSSDESVAIAARLLRQEAELAIAAKGQPDEAHYAEGTRGYAVGMQKACIKAGYA